MKSERAAQLRAALAACLRELELDRIRRESAPPMWLEGALQLVVLLLWLAAVLVSAAGIVAVFWLVLDALGPLGFPKG